MKLFKCALTRGWPSEQVQMGGRGDRKRQNKWTWLIIPVSSTRKPPGARIAEHRASTRTTIRDSISRNTTHRQLSSSPSDDMKEVMMESTRRHSSSEDWRILLKSEELRFQCRRCKVDKQHFTPVQALEKERWRSRNKSFNCTKWRRKTACTFNVRSEIWRVRKDWKWRSSWRRHCRSWVWDYFNDVGYAHFLFTLFHLKVELYVEKITLRLDKCTVTVFEYAPGDKSKISNTSERLMYKALY